MSGLQKQVLGLFREALRVARTKDPSVQASTNPRPGIPPRTCKKRATESPLSGPLIRTGARRIPVAVGRSAGRSVALF